VLPCRLLPAALAAVADGGEVWMLDSANYNSAQVEVTKSVTILAIPGALGSVVATGGGNAINIDTAGVKVALRNLVIVHLTSSSSGVSLLQGAQLNVAGCEISGMQQRGIAVYTGNVTVKDTVLRNNAYGFSAGASVVASLDRVHAKDNSTAGIWVSGGSVTISNSVLSGNGTGAQAFSNGGGVMSRVAVDGSVLIGNFNGISATATLASDSAEVTASRNIVTHNTNAGISTASGGTVTVVAGGNTITENTYGIVVSGATTIHSRGTNTLAFNTTDVAGGALTPLAGQ